MLIFKNDASTMDGVLRNAMHATDGRPSDINKGDIILIAQTKGTLLEGQKPIRWVMDFVSCNLDISDESKKIWGKKWQYVIRGENLRSVEPFDIDQIKVSKKNYGAIQTHGIVDSADEAVILKWIQEESRIAYDEGKVAAAEFELGILYSPDRLISEFDKKYSDTPAFKDIVVRQIQRPSALSAAIKEKYGYTCRICGYSGFRKKGGGLYAEVHHMIELSNLAPLTLQSWNLLVVCPTCHKKLHYGNVSVHPITKGWKIVIDAKELIVN